MVSPSPSAQTMDRGADNVLMRLQTSHGAVPDQFTGGSSGTKVFPGVVVDCFTWLNFLWTTDVKVLSGDGEMPVVVSYGWPPLGVPYGIVEWSEHNVTLVGKLGAGTGTRFEPLPETSLIKMTYVRYGAETTLLLFKRNSDAASREAWKRSGYGCCGHGCIACCKCMCIPCLVFRGPCAKICYSCCGANSSSTELQ